MGSFFKSFVLWIVNVLSVWALEVQPALRLDLLNELNVGESYTGISRVQGFHNDSSAFLFKGMQRSVRASAGVADGILQKLKGRSEFTLLLTLKQDKFNSGVLLSIHHGEQRYLELESSGQRSEIRLHYWTSEQMNQTEIFPYSLADTRWHRVALSISNTQLVLYVDCSRIYERMVETPSMDFPSGTTVWLGQRNAAHGFFKGVMQDVELLLMPQGYVSQCPDLNRTCPTCNDFHSLVQKIMELQDILAKTSSKLAHAEERMKDLDGCYCERTCSLNGEIYRDDEVWIDGCRNCTCLNGTVECESIYCPEPQCPSDTAPAYIPGACCKECQPVCIFRGRVYVEGERRSVHNSTGNCLLYECRGRSMQKVESTACPALKCPESEQISLTERCCKVCRGHDFCGEVYSTNCVENSECKNLEAGACCTCKDGYRALRDDSAYCQDIDECAEGKHYCRENTVCVNTPGSFMCVCHTGYIRIDDYSCTEHDECINGQHNCDENALCFNTVGGHSCACKPGYLGNGTICRAQCHGLCQNGGSCMASGTCICQQGFTGRRCETDIDECSDGFVECDTRAICVNLPGWYHCECRDGYHDNGMFSSNGESCEELTECKQECALNDTLVYHRDEQRSLLLYQSIIPCPGSSLSDTGKCACRMLTQPKGAVWTRTNVTLVMDIDECEMGRHSCTNDTVCFNIDGGYDCRCPHGKNCTGDCIHDGKVKHNRQIWVLDEDRCAVCSCQSGLVMCRRMVCDCDNPTVDVSCCPECDPRLSSKCLHHNGLLTYNSGDTWVENCQQCQCIHGEVDCWPMPCTPVASCEYLAVPEGECCPRCVSDPCQADTVYNDITKTCLDEYGITRLGGSTWTKQGTECSLCQCKNGHVCCSVDPLCL